MARYGREVIDRVRIDRANQLRTEHARCKPVKGARGRLLLKTRDSLHTGEEVTLKELLEANRGLCVVYVMRDAFKERWRYLHLGYARRASTSWYRKALSSGLAPLRHFAQKLRPNLAGIRRTAAIPSART